MPSSSKAAGRRWRMARSSAGRACPACSRHAVEEIWTSANCAFKLCPMLTHSAIEALEQVGTPGQQQTYLPKLISGEWTGTMNLTEPQAGSDLAQVRMRAVPAGDHYRLFGQKIFITYGEHDFTREHRPPGAGAHRRRAGRREGHFAVRRAEVPAARGRLARRAQRRALPVHRAQARHPCHLRPA